MPEMTSEDLISNNPYTGDVKLDLPGDLYYLEHPGRYSHSKFKVKVPLMTDVSIANMFI